MAEVTGLRNNALPYPIYGAPFGIVYPFLDADGDLVTGASTPDAERSLNGDTFADCTNESVEIATASGVYYLLLTAAELTCDVLAVIAKSATAGMKTTVATLYPRKLVTIRSGTSASGGVSTSTIVLDASASAVDDYYNGMVCIATIDSNVEVRVITDYTGSTQTCTVVPDWNVAPDNNDTFVIKLPEGIQRPHVDKIYSDTTHIHSDTTTIQSDTTTLASDLAEGDFSDILSRLTVTNSNLLIVKSDTSDIRSALVIIVSDTTAIHTQTTQINSDVISQFVVIEQNTSDTESMLLLIRSDTTHIESDAVRIESDTTRIESDTTTLASDLAEADFSDLSSLLTKVYSDTTAIHTQTTKIDSDQTSQFTILASQFVVLEQNTSDTESMLVLIRSDTTRIESDTNTLASDLAEGDFSDILSRLTIIASDTARIESDQISQATIVASQFVVLEQNTSDTESMLALIRSDTAAIEAATATGALSSDQDSKLTRIATAIVEVDTSDIHSLLTKVYSDTALATGTNQLPGQGAPAASATERDMIAYLYKAWRNRTTQTSSEYALYAADGVTKDHEAVVSDDGTTTTRGEVVTGA
jgi:hypothetical protein